MYVKTTKSNKSKQTKQRKKESGKLKAYIFGKEQKEEG